MKTWFPAVVIALSILAMLAIKSRVVSRVDRQVQHNLHLEWLVTVYREGGTVEFEVNPDADLQYHFDGSVSWMTYSGYRTRVHGTFTVEPRYDEDWDSESDE